MDYVKYIELPFKVIASYEPPESDVGYPGGVTIEDVELDGESVFMGGIQDAIEKRIRDLEGDMMEEVAEHMRDEAEARAADYIDWKYEQMRDRKMMRRGL